TVALSNDTGSSDIDSITSDGSLSVTGLETDATVGIFGPSTAGVVISPATGLNLNGFNVNNASAVPEPGSVLALAGVFAVGGVRRWRKKKVADVSV
uniref:PEP-CTERM sorting domain-containing protein n=2 Tax=Rhodopirellula TaxID=265488 RepID=UPI00257B6BF4